MMELELLRQQFNGHVAFRERRPGVLQVLAPLFHEDGDMVDIFLDEPANGTQNVRVSDHGMTLMRLTYSYDLDTGNKQRIFNRILSENRIQEQDGRLFIEAEPDRLYPAILHFAQTVAKVSSMQFFKRVVIRGRTPSPSPATTSTKSTTSSTSARARSIFSESRTTTKPAWPPSPAWNSCAGAFPSRA